MAPRKKKTAASWERNLPDEWLACRDTSIHHAWQSGTVERLRGGYRRTMVCSRCGSTKIQKLDSSGYILSSSIAGYPDGYLRPKGTGQLTKADNARIRLGVMQQGGRLRVVRDAG